MHPAVARRLETRDGPIPDCLLRVSEHFGFPLFSSSFGLENQKVWKVRHLLDFELFWIIRGFPGSATEQNWRF